MEITLGDKIKINGEEVPEYLLQALYEKLHLIYAKTELSEEPMTITLSDDKTQVLSLEQGNKTVYYRGNRAWALSKCISGFPREVMVKNVEKIHAGAITYPWSKLDSQSEVQCMPLMAKGSKVRLDPCKILEGKIVTLSIKADKVIAG